MTMKSTAVIGGMMLFLSLVPAISQGFWELPTALPPDEHGNILINRWSEINGVKPATFSHGATRFPLQGAPDYHALPVGNAGNVTAYWWGYCHYRELGMVDLQPKMLGFQAAGSGVMCDLRWLAFKKPSFTNVSLFEASTSNSCT